MTTGHTDVGAPSCVFDQFMVDRVATLPGKLPAADFDASHHARTLEGDPTDVRRSLQASVISAPRLPTYTVLALPSLHKASEMR